jgi:dipeptidyl aminopeptidase/acylaminoacyl peptidase
MFRVRVVLGLMAGLILAASAVAGATSPPLEAYARAPAIANVSLSPSGKRAAFLVANAKGRVVAIQELGGKLLTTVGMGDAKLRGLEWAGDDFLLITTSKTVDLGMYYGFKHELTKVEVVDIAAPKLTTVFENASRVLNVVEGSYGAARIDGRWYGFFGGQAVTRSMSDSYIQNNFRDLYRVDLETGATSTAAPGNAREHDWVIGPDGSVIAHTEYDSGSGQWRLLEGPGPAGRVVMARSMPLDEIDLVGQGRTPGTVLLQDDSGQQSVTLEVTLKGGQTEPLFGGQEVRRHIYDRQSGLLLGAVVGGPDGAVLFDAAKQARLWGAFKAFPDYRRRLVSWDPTFDHLIVFTDGGDDSGTYWFVDIASGKALPIGPDRPDVPSEAVGPTRLVAYKAADGISLDGVLTLPPGRPAKGLSLIVMPHGGPLGFHDEVGFDWWAQAFASRGYAVFQPNFRGSSGHGLAFERAGFGEWGRKMLSDMSDSIAALAAQGVIDPHRACIVGGSYGGYAALAGVTLQHGLYRCAVSFAGVADLPALQWWDEGRTTAVDEMVRYWRIAVKGEDKSAPALAAISPAQHADAADAPVLLVHGKDDTVVPIEQSRRMKSALEAAHKPVELIELTGQDHWLTDEPTRTQMLKAAVAFVEKHNPPG